MGHEQTDLSVLLQPVLRPSVRGAFPLAVALVFIGGLVERLLPFMGEDWSTFLVALLAMILAPFLFLLVGRSRLAPQAIELGAGRLRVPDFRGRFSVDFAVRDIRSIIVTESFDKALWIETGSHRFIYPTSFFVDPRDPQRLVEAVADRLRALPDGEARAANIVRDHAEANAAYRRLPRVGITVGAVLLSAFIVSLALGGLGRTFALLPLGANVDFFVQDGEWYRLILSNFLHSGLLHLGLVVTGIVVLSLELERLYGRGLVLFGVLAASLVGAASTLVGGGLYIVGASPALFGLLGMLAFTLSQYRRELTIPFRPSLRWWIWFGTLLAGLSAMVPEMDFGANLAGLLVGVLLVAVVTNGRPHLPLLGRAPSWTWACSGVLGVLFLVGVVWGVSDLSHNSRGRETRLLERVLDADQQHAWILNKIAWEIGTDAESTPKQLELAEVAAQRSLDRSADVMALMVKDTLATVKYRRGKYREAMELERAVLESGNDAFIASQLARFIDADQRKSGSDDAAVRMTLAGSGGEQVVRVDVDERIREPTMVYAVIRDARDRSLLGLLRAQIPARVGTPWEVRLQDRGVVLDFEGPVELDVGWSATGTTSWAAWRMQPRATALP